MKQITLEQISEQIFKKINRLDNIEEFSDSFEKYKHYKELKTLIHLKYLLDAGNFVYIYDFEKYLYKTIEQINKDILRIANDTIDDFTHPIVASSNLVSDLTITRKVYIDVFYNFLGYDFETIKIRMEELKDL